MEGAPAPPAGRLPQRGRAELQAVARDLGRLRDASQVPPGAELPRPPHTHTHTHTPLHTAAPCCSSGSALLPIAGGFVERGSRLHAAGAPGAGRGSPGEPRWASARPAGSGGGPALLGLPSCRDGDGNLPGARRRARAALETRRSPRSSSPPRRALAPARCPGSGARSLPPPLSRRSDRRRRRSSGPRASSQAAPLRPPPGSGSEAKSGRRRAPSGRCVRRPRSRPRLCSARSELQVKPRGGPAEAPPRRPAPAFARPDAGLKGAAPPEQHPAPAPLKCPPGRPAPPYHLYWTGPMSETHVSRSGEKGGACGLN